VSHVQYSNDISIRLHGQVPHSTAHKLRTVPSFSHRNVSSVQIVAHCIHTCAFQADPVKHTYTASHKNVPLYFPLLTPVLLGRYLLSKVYVDLYSASMRKRLERAQIWITQCYLQTTPYLPLLPSRRASAPFGRYSLRLPTEGWAG